MPQNPISSSFVRIRLSYIMYGLNISIQFTPQVLKLANIVWFMQFQKWTNYDKTFVFWICKTAVSYDLLSNKLCIPSRTSRIRTKVDVPEFLYQVERFLGSWREPKKSFRQILTDRLFEFSFLQCFIYEWQPTLPFTKHERLLSVKRGRNFTIRNYYFLTESKMEEKWNSVTS
jgi:hypothetical protein